MSRGSLENWRAWLSCLAMCVFVALASGQSPELVVEVDRQEVYEGESIDYRLTLNHVEDPVPPTLDGFDDFRVTPLGEQSLDSRRITIVNGVRNEVIRRGRQYQYRLTPLRSGDLTIPPPTARAGNAVLRGEAIPIRVIAPQEQDTVLLEANAQPDVVYPTQPFTISLTIAVKELPGELESRDPLSVQSALPDVTVPWLDDEQLPDGIEAKKPWNDVLQPLVSRRGLGVQINNIRSPSAFSLFEGEAMGFRPGPAERSVQDLSGTEAGYWEYRFERTLIPRRAGEFDFGTATLKGGFATKLSGGRLVGEQFYAVSRPVRVVVRDVPRRGRPASYIGAIGKLTAKAQLAPLSARVGDPLTLTLTLSGAGNLADTQPPDVATVPEIASSFKTYEATAETEGGTRQFSYSLRPLTSDVTEFPSIPVSYFDVEQERFVTIRTDPIPVTITAAETLSETDIIDSADRSEGVGVALQSRAGGIFANDTNFKSLRNQRVQLRQWLGLWAGLLGTYTVLVVAIRYARRLAGDTGWQRSRLAPARARAALRQASLENQAGQHRAACDALRRAVTGLIADYANVSEAGLTPRDAVHALSTMGLDAELCQQTLRLLEECDAASYGAATARMAELERDGHDVVDRLARELRKRRRRSAAVGLVLLGLLTNCSGCGKTVDLETVRQLQLAEENFGKAKTREGFIEVAGQYQRILDQGFVAGAILYNQGNAWMRAKEIGRAIASYRQAQRYRPRDPYLEANLRAALPGNRPVAPDLGFWGYVFFWQNWLSYPEKALAVTLLLCLALSTQLLSCWPTDGTILRRISLAAAVLCGFALVSIIWDWQRFERTTHGVVVADEVVARKGNSDSYEPAFTEPLAAGTEFTVLEQRRDWLQVQIQGSGTGWLPERNAVLF